MEYRGSFCCHRLTLKYACRPSCYSNRSWSLDNIALTYYQEAQLKFELRFLVTMRLIQCVVSLISSMDRGPFASAISKASSPFLFGDGAPTALDFRLIVVSATDDLLHGRSENDGLLMLVFGLSSTSYHANSHAHIGPCKIP